MPPLARIETDRLRLRERRREDLDALVDMELDPEVNRYSDLRSNFVARTSNRSDLRKRFRLELRSGTPRHFWVIEPKQNPTFLGLAGLFAERPRIIGVPYRAGMHFLMYRLTRSAWGQGIATEAALAILDFGFHTLNCPTIAAFSHKDNMASSKVLKKLGMARTGDITIPFQSSVIANGANSLVDIYSFYELERETFMSLSPR